MNQCTKLFHTHRTQVQGGVPAHHQAEVRRVPLDLYQLPMEVVEAVLAVAQRQTLLLPHHPALVTREQWFYWELRRLLVLPLLLHLYQDAESRRKNIL